MKNTLYIIRGVSGSGKSFSAETLAERSIFGIKLKSYPICNADDFFTNDGKYIFDAKLLGQAHKYCFDKCENSLKSKTKKVFVNNTSTRTRDVNTYVKLAKKYNYNFVVMTNEIWHENDNIHNVPDLIIRKQTKQLMQSIKLSNDVSILSYSNLLSMYKTIYVGNYIMINNNPKLVNNITCSLNNLYFNFADKTKELIQLNKQYNIRT